MLFYYLLSHFVYFQIKLDQCVSDLTKLKSGQGHFQQQLSGDMDNNGKTFKGHHITGCNDDEITSARDKFISQILENISDRYTVISCSFTDVNIIDVIHLIIRS